VDVDELDRVRLPRRAYLSRVVGELLLAAVSRRPA
jgi:hypothetical protein